MPAYRHQLPQLTGGVFLTDGGIETTSSTTTASTCPTSRPSSTTPPGTPPCSATSTPTSTSPCATGGHRAGDADVAASPDWGARQSYTAERLIEVNQAAVDLSWPHGTWERPDTPVVISGCIVPAVTATSPRS